MFRVYKKTRTTDEIVKTFEVKVILNCKIVQSYGYIFLLNHSESQKEEKYFNRKFYFYPYDCIPQYIMFVRDVKCNNIFASQNE